MALGGPAILPRPPVVGHGGHIFLEQSQRGLGSLSYKLGEHTLVTPQKPWHPVLAPNPHQEGPLRECGLLNLLPVEGVPSRVPSPGPQHSEGLR